MPVLETIRRYVVLAVALLLPTLITLVYFVWLKDSGAIVYGPLKLAQFALPLAYVYFLGRARAEAWRAPDYQARRSSLLVGIGFGLFVLIAGMSLYFAWLEPQGVFAASGAAIQGKVASFGVGSPARFLALGLFYSLIHSALEEYYWRWFVFRECRALAPRWPAIAISSLGFMAHHVFVLAEYFGWASPLTFFFSLAVAVGGAFWAWLYARYGTLWGPWLSHLLVDAGIFWIGYQLVFAG